MSKHTILEHRFDMTEYLFHWTTQENLKHIIWSGFFIAGHAWRAKDWTKEEWIPTIRGEAMAVCFSEMPVGNFLQSTIAHQPYSDKRWGIAILKETLYAYGCRPVLYGDEELYGELDKQHQHLFSRMEISLGKDWTHEREWRVKPNLEINAGIGLKGGIKLYHVYEEGSSDGLTKRNTVQSERLVPVCLPRAHPKRSSNNSLSDEPEFVILVETDQDIALIQERARSLHGPSTSPVGRLLHGQYSSVAEYQDQYLAILQRARVVSFERIRDQRDRMGIWRLEDLLASTADQEGRIAILWEKATMPTRRRVLKCVSMEGEELDGKYAFHGWWDLPEPSASPLFPAPCEPPAIRQRIEQTTEAVSILQEDVREWASQILGNLTG